METKSHLFSSSSHTAAPSSLLLSPHYVIYYTLNVLRTPRVGWLLLIDIVVVVSERSEKSSGKTSHVSRTFSRKVVFLPLRFSDLFEKSGVVYAVAAILAAVSLTSSMLPDI